MKIMGKSELQARELLRLALLQFEGGHECDYCGEPLNAPHEKDCIVPRIEKLVDRKMTDLDERTAKCEHRRGRWCAHCIARRERIARHGS